LCVGRPLIAAGASKARGGSGRCSEGDGGRHAVSRSAWYFLGLHVRTFVWPWRRECVRDVAAPKRPRKRVHNSIKNNGSETAHASKRNALLSCDAAAGFYTQIMAAWKSQCFYTVRQTGQTRLIDRMRRTLCYLVFGNLAIKPQHP
jgi:hypothetical protein